jgi:Spy/CpxP family protein refolding chaperone
MNVQLKSCSLVIGLVLVSSMAFADWNMSVDDKVGKMTKNLTLTSDQVIAVRPVIQEYKDKMDQIEQDKMQKLRGILTADQLTKMQNMKNDRYSQ